VKPVAFDYHRPQSLPEALALVADMREEAMLLAGGMTLGPMLNMRLVRPRAVIDISRLQTLQSISVKGDVVMTGAGVVQRDAMHSDIIGRELPLLLMALPWVGHFQTRNRGTLGGSVAHADPSAEIPLCLSTCGGTVVLQSRRRERRIGAADFFLGALATARQPDEIITALEWPRTLPGTGCAFAEIAQRRGDFAIAAAACYVRLQQDGRLAGLALGVGGVENRPVSINVEDFYGHAPEQVGSDLAEHVCANVMATDDHAASGEFRLALTKELVTRVFDEAVAKAKQHGGRLQ
jgi:2-furoyl-CoA dehydrogenase FAD binding subunit